MRVRVGVKVSGGVVSRSSKTWVGRGRVRVRVGVRVSGGVVSRSSKTWVGVG